MQEQRRQLDLLFTYHAIAAIVTGGICVLLPHSLASTFIGSEYSHMVHEIFRLYGALTLAQGWLVWQTRKVADAFVRKTFCQAYCICFSLQTLALFRAQVTSPEQHSWLNWLNILLFLSLGSSYSYFLVFKPIKVFELPGSSNLE